ncbi:MAG: hypothetical protein IPK19_25640 [Chloroflexi bacterium]|nr:hypothetical protein [Chloroflexota bacterium]
MTTPQVKPLTYLEWVALIALYQHRDRVSSPLRYIGLPATVDALAAHQPPLVQWVGKRSENQIHITAEGIATCEATHTD